MVETWTWDYLDAYVRKHYQDEAGSVLRTIRGWLARGDGVAVYENHDLGHPEVGEPRLASYGSPAAMLETDEPPQRLPDTPNLINWRYQLIATYRGEPGG